ncbi:MAG: DUF4157 domain-containing protein [Anaerolineae bacterium]|nr:DUF4157 domain-containing protein [Anaerolineae bacterium]
MSEHAPKQVKPDDAAHQAKRTTASENKHVVNQSLTNPAHLIQLQGLIGNQAVGRLIMRKVNNTGLPDNLKSGVESLSGVSMDDVQVHYNSPKPAQLQALAYAQGTDIHVGPGQESHLPHEAWHVVQQKQGRVQPTVQMEGTHTNTDKSLDTEADTMGAKAAGTKPPAGESPG